MHFTKPFCKKTGVRADYRSKWVPKSRQIPLFLPLKSCKAEFGRIPKHNYFLTREKAAKNINPTDPRAPKAVFLIQSRVPFGCDFSYLFEKGKCVKYTKSITPNVVLAYEEASIFTLFLHSDFMFFRDLSPNGILEAPSVIFYVTGRFRGSLTGLIFNPKTTSTPGSVKIEQ